LLWVYDGMTAKYCFLYEFRTQFMNGFMCGFRN
jgi:hypothetical protein